MKTIPQLEEIHGFQCPSEFERFESWINKFVRNGAIEEIDVSERYIGATVFSERWFKDKSTGLIWRLIPPEYSSFKGVFEKVDEADETMKTIPQLEEIHEFQCPSEFERFESWINKFVRDGAIEEVNVLKPYIGSTVFLERWFKDKSTGLIWRLVAPDYPFKGVFEKVDES